MINSLQRSSTMRTRGLMSLVLVLSTTLAVSNACTSGESGGDQRSPDSPQRSPAADPVLLHVSDKAHYESLEDLFIASTLVIHGTVVEVVPGEVLSSAAPEAETSHLQMAEYTVRAIDVFKGQAGPMITAIRESYAVNAEGVRDVSLNGISPNAVGDTVLWFLEESEGRPGLWEQISLDGLFLVEDDKVVSELISDGLGRRLTGSPLSAISDRLNDLSERAQK